VTSAFDFEIDAALRARDLTVRVRQGGTIEPEGGTDLDRQESRTKLRPGKRDEKVQITARARGRLRSPF